MELYITVDFSLPLINRSIYLVWVTSGSHWHQEIHENNTQTVFLAFSTNERRRRRGWKAWCKITGGTDTRITAAAPVCPLGIIIPLLFSRSSSLSIDPFSLVLRKHTSLVTLNAVLQKTGCRLLSSLPAMICRPNLLTRLMVRSLFSGLLYQFIIPCHLLIQWINAHAYTCS